MNIICGNCQSILGFDEIEAERCFCCGTTEYKADHIRYFPPHPDNSKIRKFKEKGGE